VGRGIRDPPRLAASRRLNGFSPMIRIPCSTPRGPPDRRARESIASRSSRPARTVLRHGARPSRRKPSSVGRGLRGRRNPATGCAACERSSVRHDRTWRRLKRRSSGRSKRFLREIELVCVRNDFSGRAFKLFLEQSKIRHISVAYDTGNGDGRRAMPPRRLKSTFMDRTPAYQGPDANGGPNVPLEAATPTCGPSFRRCSELAMMGRTFSTTRRRERSAGDGMQNSRSFSNFLAGTDHH